MDSGGMSRSFAQPSQSQPGPAPGGSAPSSQAAPPGNWLQNIVSQMQAQGNTAGSTAPPGINNAFGGGSAAPGSGAPTNPFAMMGSQQNGQQNFGGQQSFGGQPNYSNMVNQAYGQIGRAGVGSGAGQIDQGSQDYWMNQLQSGAVSPQNFSNIFANSAQQANPSLTNIYQNQALSQVSGGRPAPGAPQFYQPVYQQQYQNYANPQTQMGVSQYGQQNYGGQQGYGGGQQFNPYTNSMSGGQQNYAPMQQPSPMQQAAPQIQPNYGSQQPIYSRSAGRRGTPNQMAYKEGGITSLLDDE